MNAFLREITVICLLTTVAEFLLPEGGMRRVGRMVFGLAMMLCMLSALLRLVPAA